jgi:hypothetical protein
LPGSHIVDTFDLIERDLCWHREIITQPRFVEFVREVKDRFRTLRLIGRKKSNGTQPHFRSGNVN